MTDRYPLLPDLTEDEQVSIRQIIDRMDNYGGFEAFAMTFASQPGESGATLYTVDAPNIPDHAYYFRKVNGRWVADQQVKDEVMA